MKILVTGYTGQLGYDVVLEGLNHKLDMIGVGSKDLDITNEQEVYRYIKGVNPDAIIHCGAYTGVDNAEDDKENCWNVNVEGTRYLATAANEIGAKFMYISTDYVFDGEGEIPFSETDKPNPIGYYGLTKLEGEYVVQDILNEVFIIRVSWVFGVNGSNFIKTMLRLSENRNEINVVGDQFGSPTYTFDLASLLINMIQGNKYGTYHATNEGFCSWADFATEIFKQVNINVKVNSITTEQFLTRAKRPKNSRMSKQKLVENDFKQLRKWQDALRHYLNELVQEVK